MSESNKNLEIRLHTPLPWKIGRVDTLVTAADQRGICSTGGYADNRIDSEELAEENRANAAFIVRACNSHYDLLEALEALMPIAEKMQGKLAGVVEAILNAEDALIKARGQ